MERQGEIYRFGVPADEGWGILSRGIGVVVVSFGRSAR